MKEVFTLIAFKFTLIAPLYSSVPLNLRLSEILIQFKYSRLKDDMVLELTVIKENMVMFLKLLVALGLTWGVEICKGIHSHFDDSNDNSTFGKILNFLNLLNVFLVMSSKYLQKVLLKVYL